MQDVPEHSWGQALTPNGTCASSVHVVTQELGNRWDQAPVPLTCRHRAFLGSPGGQGGAAETTYHSIRTINSIHINLCYKSYKGGCFWVFRSTFYFKAVYSVFINCLEKKKRYSHVRQLQRIKNRTASETPFIPDAEQVRLRPPHRVYLLFAKPVVTI